MCGFDELLKSNKSNDEHQDSGMSINNSNNGEECNILSIGSNKQWAFEKEIISRTKCNTHTFDCTTADDPQKPEENRISYYPYCVSDENKNVNDRDFLTYAKVVEKVSMEN